MPGSFFEASVEPLFSLAQRELPVDLHFPFQENERVSLKLPAGWVVESLPANTQLALARSAGFGVVYKLQDKEFIEDRTLLLAVPFFEVSEYAGLRDFNQKVGAQDQQQLILKQQAPSAAQ